MKTIEQLEQLQKDIKEIVDCQRMLCETEGNLLKINKVITLVIIEKIKLIDSLIKEVNNE